MRIAICDDNNFHLNSIDKYVHRLFDFKMEDCTTALYNNGNKLIADQKISSFDAIFLDIEMPEIDGFKVASKLKEIDENTIIVFITSKNDLVYDSLSFRPFQFVCKDKIEESLKRTVFELLKYWKKESVFITLDTPNEIRRIRISNVMYIETDKNLLVAYTTREKIIFREKMSAMEAKLEQYGFLRIHTSYLVNYRYIEKVEKDKIVLDDQEQLPISRYRTTEVMKKYRKILESRL